MNGLYYGPGWLSCLLVLCTATGCRTLQLPASVVAAMPGERTRFQKQNSNARLLEQQSELVQAEQSYQDLARRFPNRYEAHQRLGIIAQKRGNKEEALRHLKRARELAPQNTDVLGDVGFVEYLAGNFAQAVETLRQAQELNPTHPRIQANLAMALVASGDVSTAHRLFRQGDDEVGALVCLGFTLIQHGKIEEGRSAFEKAVLLDPHNAKAAEAIVQLADLPKMGSPSPSNLSNLGIAVRDGETVTDDIGLTILSSVNSSRAVQLSPSVQSKEGLATNAFDGTTTRVQELVQIGSSSESEIATAAPEDLRHNPPREPAGKWVKVMNSGAETRDGYLHHELARHSTVAVSDNDTDMPHEWGDGTKLRSVAFARPGPQLIPVQNERVAEAGSLKERSAMSSGAVISPPPISTVLAEPATLRTATAPSQVALSVDTFAAHKVDLVAANWMPNPATPGHLLNQSALFRANTQADNDSRWHLAMSLLANHEQPEVALRVIAELMPDQPAFERIAAWKSIQQLGSPAQIAGPRLVTLASTTRGLEAVESAYALFKTYGWREYADRRISTLVNSSDQEIHERASEVLRLIHRSE